jgi:superfamily II DNA or RNA helicase
VRVGLLGGGRRGHVVDAEILISVVNSAARLIPDQMRSISSKREVLLVADECHRLGATTFSRVLGAPFAATLGLSATPERAGDYGMEHLVFPSLGDVVFKYTHADGLADGVIADFAIALIGVDFTSGERGDFERANERVSDVLDWLLDAHPDLKGLGDEREFHAAVQALATREDSPALAFKAAIGKRKDIVISAVRRLELVTWLFEHARPAGKVILFHERIAACEALAEHLVPAAGSDPGADRIHVRAVAVGLRVPAEELEVAESWR